MSNVRLNRRLIRLSTYSSHGMRSSHVSGLRSLAPETRVKAPGFSLLQPHFFQGTKKDDSPTHTLLYMFYSAVQFFSPHLPWACSHTHHRRERAAVLPSYLIKKTILHPSIKLHKTPTKPTLVSRYKPTTTTTVCYTYSTSQQAKRSTVLIKEQKEEG